MLCAWLDCTEHIYVGLSPCKHRYTSIHNKHNRMIIKEVFIHVRMYEHMLLMHCRCVGLRCGLPDVHTEI